MHTFPDNEKEIKAGESLLSPNGAYEFVMQSDGNAVTYPISCKRQASCAGFRTSTVTSNPILRMQSDGNLVLYDTVARAGNNRFDTGKVRSGEYILAQQNEGNLVLYQVVVASSRALQIPTQPVTPAPGKGTKPKVPPTPGPIRDKSPPSFNSYWSGSYFSMNAASKSDQTYSCSFSYSFEHDDFGTRKTRTNWGNFTLSPHWSGNAHTLTGSWVRPTLTSGPNIQCN